MTRFQTLPKLRRGGPAQRGLAALTVVMVLFFVMALVAAYTNRNLLFEQRISANNYRVARAVNAADAGIEWALAMLNGGRVDELCRPSTNAADQDWRRRYLSDVGADSYGLLTGTNAADQMFPACIGQGAALSCICPSTSNRAPAIGLPADGAGSAFGVAFVPPTVVPRPGTMIVTARGCASIGSGNSACYAQNPNRPQVDALSNVLATVGLVRALPLSPIAALTAGTVIDAAAGELWVANDDPERGLTAHAGGDINLGAGTNNFVGPAGSTADGRQPNDATLSQLAAAANDGWFRAMFGMDKTSFLRSPATRRIDCANGCASADLTNVVAGYPRNPIWLAGDLTLDGTADLGSDANPVMLVVDGALTVSGNLRITGFVHATSIVWQAGGASVKGAMASATSFTATARATLAYDRSVMDLIQWRYGSFVRVPGSWGYIDKFGIGGS